MPRVGFEPTISAGERPKTYALDRAATGTGTHLYYPYYFHRDTKLDESIIQDLPPYWIIGVV